MTRINFKKIVVFFDFCWCRVFGSFSKNLRLQLNRSTTNFGLGKKNIGAFLRLFFPRVFIAPPSTLDFIRVYTIHRTRCNYMDELIDVS